jgi:hypothetical protein
VARRVTEVLPPPDADPDGGQRPEVIITDTGSYSDVVFGLLTLLGFDYRRSWRIYRTRNCGGSTARPTTVHPT